MKKTEKYDYKYATFLLKSEGQEQGWLGGNGGRKTT